MPEKEHNKYVVIKVSDIAKYLTPAQCVEFDSILADIRYGRVHDNRGLYNNYIVCNQDEPYSELVWQLILLGERAKGAKEEAVSNGS